MKSLVGPWAAMVTVHSRESVGSTLITYPVQRKPVVQYSKLFLILLCFRYEGDNFVLDQQVVRAALKTYRALLSAKTPSESNLSPSSNYLRLLFAPTAQPPQFSAVSWDDPATSILLLEWRAAVIVHECAQNQSALDASMNQRASRAITEAFVAVQVREMIKNVVLPEKETQVVSDLQRLVSKTISIRRNEHPSTDLVA